MRARRQTFFRTKTAHSWKELTPILEESSYLTLYLREGKPSRLQAGLVLFGVWTALWEDKSQHASLACSLLWIEVH
jgi:hypothetical protein